MVCSSHEDTHDHISNFVDVLRPILLQDHISRFGLVEVVSIFSSRLSVQIIGRIANKLHPIFEDLVKSFQVRFSMLRRYWHFRIISFPYKVLLQYFYWSLHLVNKGVADQLYLRGLMQQTYIIAPRPLDCMTKNNRSLVVKIMTQLDIP